LQLIAAVDFGTVMSWIGVILQVAAGLGLVIFVHELGHFLVAKACGVKCEKFYIGFDVPIKLGWGRWGIPLPASLWKRQWGETEYGIGIIPLGGYVKMLGQDDNPANAEEEIERSKLKSAEGDTEAVSAPQEEEIDPRSYRAKSVPQRMAIISAGVVMNVIFAFIFAIIAYLIGVPYTTSTVGAVVPGQAGYRAGIQRADRIREIDGKGIYAFEQVLNGIVLGNKDRIPVKVKRPSVEELVSIDVKPDALNDERKRQMIGISSAHTNAIHHVLDNTPAAKIKDMLTEGDRVIKIQPKGGKPLPVESYWDIEAILVRHPDVPLTFTFERNKNTKKPDAEPTYSVEIEPNPVRELGLVVEMGKISAIEPGSPADGKGLRRGDRIYKIDGNVPSDPMQVAELLRQKASGSVDLEIVRQEESGGEVKEVIPILLREPTWQDQSLYSGTPYSVPALGLTYHVIPKVNDVVQGSPADAHRESLIGSEIVKAQFKPLKEPIEFGLTNDKRSRHNWPMFIEALQSLPAGTTIKLWYRAKPSSEMETVELELANSDKWFNPMRGFVFDSEREIKKADSIGEAIKLAVVKTKQSLMLVFSFLNKLRRQELSMSMLGGPITIARAAGHYAFAGMGPFLIFLTMLSANLAVLNFLPIPVLDGGHMVFLILEGIFRRPVSDKVVIIMHWIGLLLILSLMIYVVGLDISRLF